MRILIPVFGFARAGGGRVLSNLATEWVKLGHQVSFLSPEGYEVYFPTKAEVLWFNDQGELLKQPNNTAAPISYFKKVLALRKLIKEIASSYDLVLVNYAPTVIPAVLAGVKAKIFYYIQANETEYLLSHPGVGFKLKALATWLTYFLIPRARCIANSDIYINYKNISTCNEIIVPGIDISTYWTKKFSTLKGRTVVLGTIGTTESYEGGSRRAVGKSVYNHQIRVLRCWENDAEVAYRAGYLDDASYKQALLLIAETRKLFADLECALDMPLFGFVSFAWYRSKNYAHLPNVFSSLIEGYLIYAHLYLYRVFNTRKWPARLLKKLVLR